MMWCVVWTCRLVGTDEENKRLKIEMSEMKARHKVELQQVQKKMEQEMEEVHQRCAACAHVEECSGERSMQSLRAAENSKMDIRACGLIFSSLLFYFCVE